MDARMAAGMPKRLGRFVLERFSPLAYGPLILALVLAGQAGATLATGGHLALSWSTAWATMAVAFGFLQLRVLDELRDEGVDRRARPERPLPRGLVSAAELRVTAVGAGVVGASLAAALGLAALVCYGLALGQVWLLGTGTGPAGGARSPGLVGDALRHSLIVPTMLAVGWASVGPLAPSLTLAATLLLAWGAGLALEVGRKTVAAADERPGIETYSSALGRSRALLLLAGLVGTMAVAASLLAAVAEAVTGVVILPVGVAAAVAAVAVSQRQRLGTVAVRATVPVLVLSALAWPPLVAWGLR
jgi:4-hydroxybenzoate polyprenyltransferase